MSKLNNKGFAISGILYTLYIVFLVIMLTVLAGLQARKTMMERSLQGLEESFDGRKRNELIPDAISQKKAPITGKYVFNITSTTSTVPGICSTYLNRGDAIDHNIKFTPNDCNDYRYSFSFEPQTSGNEMDLKDIYSYESEEIGG